MKSNPRLHRLPKALRRPVWPRVLGYLAVFQLSLLLFLAMTWSQPPITLSFVVPASGDFPWPELVADFQKQNPGIRLEIVQGDYDTDQVEAIYTAELQAKAPRYDLVFLDLIWLSKFAEKDLLMDLSDWVTPAELSQFLPAAVESGKYHQKIYRIPFLLDVGVLSYRKDLLEEAGYEPPETFDELQKIARELQEGDKADWGFLWQGAQYEGLVAVFVEVLEGYGGFWIDPQTLAVGLDRPEAIQAVQFLRDAIASGISPPEVTTYREAETLKNFEQGEAVFLRSWPYPWTKLSIEKPDWQSQNDLKLQNKDINLQGRVGLAPVPSAPGYPSRGCHGGWGLSIARTAKHPELAWRAIQFFSSEAVQHQLAEAGYIPSHKALFDNPDVVQKYPYLPELKEWLSSSVFRPPIPEYDRASDILQLHLSKVLLGQSSQNAMAMAAQETRELLNKRQVGNLGVRGQGSGWEGAKPQ